MAEEITIENYRLNTLDGIAESLAKAGMIDKALEIVEKISDKFIRSLALANVGKIVYNISCKR